MVIGKCVSRAETPHRGLGAHKIDTQTFQISAGKVYRTQTLNAFTLQIKDKRNVK
jgi:hypothetical protein